jgi:photosystem II stability/assembly factor-like uncharacterized protein
MRRERYSNHFVLATWMIAALWCWQSTEARAQEVGAQGPRAWLEDAELHDVRFANPLEGWAVGDRGAVWHTADAGANWKLQRTDTQCSFVGAAFVDAQRGWAVGAEHNAYASGSGGVMLSTQDGGTTWKRAETPLLAGLRGIHAFTTEHARAWGSRSSIFPNSLYWTSDAGRGWNPFSGELSDEYVDVAFAGPQFGAAITRRGSVLSIVDRGVRPARHPDTELRGLQRIRWCDEQHGVIVGDGGLVWLTDDGGQSWRESPTTVPRTIDFKALATKGAHVWAAGSPGSVIWHSADRGATWESLATGHNVPLNAITFVDETHGWAVGALGVILATDDGGKTWRAQRAGGKRAGVLGIFADAESTPWEILALTCGQEGALGAAHFVVRRDWLRPEADDRGATDSLRGALSAVGGAAAERSWRFPVGPREAEQNAEGMVELWNELHDGAGLEELEAELARRIRTWRPEVIFTHAAPPRGDDPLAFVLNQVVLKAAESAANQQYRADEMNALRLSPWKVKKIYGAKAKGETGGDLLATTQLAPELGCSLGQQAGMARAMACERPVTGGGVLAFQLMASQLPESASGRGFLGGLNLPAGGDARRAAVAARDRSGDQLREIAVRQRNLQAILTRTEEERDASAVLAQLPELIRSLGAEAAAPLLLDLATRFRGLGKYDAAAETYGLLVERYPDHAFAAPAMAWLIQYWSSGEVAHRTRAREAQALAKTSREGQVFDSGQGVELTGFAESVDVPSSTNATGDQLRASRASRTQALLKLLGRTRPSLAAEPAVTFPLYALERDSTGDAQRAVGRLPKGRADAAWRSSVAAEAWKANGSQGECPKTVWSCRRGAQRPKLDGVLDDPIWEHAAPVELEGATDDANAWPTTVVTAYDEQFLYVAIACAKAPQRVYETAQGARERDADLSGADRVEISLDIDRDYVTAWQFTVDEQGRGRDACWGDLSWDPKWYIAASQNDGAWFAEAAIPLSELSVEPAKVGTAWTVTVKRVAPGAGVQAWCAPAMAEDSLEEGGWLVFE